MDILHNTRPAPLSGLDDVPMPSTDAPHAQELVERCLISGQTPLHRSETLAAQASVQEVWIKDERSRMGLGSFKALGAAYVIACDAQDANLTDRTYVTASAGNHGISVAFGAKTFGAMSVIYIAQTVPQSFAARLEELGARVVRAGATYEDSLLAAETAAKENGWILLSDGSWEGYIERPHRLMEGYTVLMAEAIEQVPQIPTHIFLQAGVGGLACACAALARLEWGDAPRIIVVEPDAAPALYGSIVAGQAIESSGPVSEMGRLDCKMPSIIALKGLAAHADEFALVTEDEGRIGARVCSEAGFAASPSGAAGVAGLIALEEGQRAALEITDQSRILCVLSEGPA